MKYLALVAVALAVGFLVGHNYGISKVVVPKNDCDAALEGCAYTASQMLYAARKAEKALERCEESLNEAQ